MIKKFIFVTSIVLQPWLYSNLSDTSGSHTLFFILNSSKSSGLIISVDDDVTVYALQTA